MGLFDILFSGSSADLDHCPYCSSALQGYGCTSCDVEFVLEDGKLVERMLSIQGPRQERTCASCSSPMSGGGEFTHAWEDGDNANPYVTCPSCGHQNPF